MGLTSMGASFGSFGSRGLPVRAARIRPGPAWRVERRVVRPEAEQVAVQSARRRMDHIWSATVAWHLRSTTGNAGAIRRRSRILAMEFLLLCVVSVLFVFTAGAFFAGRG